MDGSFENRTGKAAPHLPISIDPIVEQSLLDNHSYFTQKISPSGSIKKHYQKDLSVRSISTSKKPQFSKLPLRHPSEIEHQETDISERARNNYEEIERILKNQNTNLKQQNQYLLRQIQRLRQSNKKYKQNCISQRLEIDGLREECEAHRDLADEMKQIITIRLKTLETKALAEQDQKLPDSGMGILQGLSLTESGMQQSR